MTGALRAFVADELSVPVSPEIAGAAQAIAGRLGGVAVLFYGSVLRTGDLDGVLDFYVLNAGVHGRGLQALGTRWLWPDVSFHEVEIAGRTIRAKVASMPLETFAGAAGGSLLDTTIWTRFVQPSALIWASEEHVTRAVIAAVMAAAQTAGRFAAMLGPDSGEPQDFWRRLFQETYRAELRVERPGREEQILAYHRQHYDALLPLAWEAVGLPFKRDGRALTPALSPAARQKIRKAWRLRRRSGKALNLARLLKASFTFEGAARYGAWKLERHTGVPVQVTPWRERHPVLAAPGVLLSVWRATRAS
jgi:hypothetical protein